MEGPTLAELAEFSTRKLRGGDLIFACGPEMLVCMLATGDPPSAKRVSDRLTSAALADKPRLQFRAAVITAPDDGTTLAQLLHSASQSFGITSPKSNEGARFINLREMIGSFTTASDVAVALRNATWQ